MEKKKLQQLFQSFNPLENTLFRYAATLIVRT